VDETIRRRSSSVEVEATPERSVLALALVGEHDISTASALAAALDEALTTAHGVVVDTTRLCFLDLAALGVLERARDAARQRGRRVVLQWGTGYPVHRVFEQTNALDRFQVSDSRAEAVALAAPVTPAAGRTVRLRIG
jgi:anti-anti-sigma factor